MFKLEKKKHFFSYQFVAMNNPCEILVEQKSVRIEQLIQEAISEVNRIEKKFSRYRDDNIVAKINSGSNQLIQLDQETNNLINMADVAFQQSEGLFDITSGAFRKVWDFNSNSFPTERAIKEALQNVGWQKVHWQEGEIKLAKNMQIDLGGIGKEYAVDKITFIFKQNRVPALVNFGGDLACSYPPDSQTTWQVGLDNPENSGNNCLKMLSLKNGAIATSGDVKKVITYKGKRYGHIINPKTGYPEQGAPRSVTVCADTCIEAGLYSTLAILHGSKADVFLKETELPYWLL